MMSNNNERQHVWIYGGAAVALAAAIGVGYLIQRTRSSKENATVAPSRVDSSSTRKPEPIETNFQSLEAAGYKFNDAQQLVSIKDGL
jgi:hypothetical protein